MIKYVTPAKHTDSFAMTRFAVTNPSGGNSPNDNIDIAARHDGSGASTRFYVVKLVYKQLIFNDYPVLAVLDETLFNPQTDVIVGPVIEGEDYINLTKPGTVGTCPGNAEDKCPANERPPLESASGSAVLQISVWKDFVNSQTVITGAVGWDCPSTPGTKVYDCAKVCCLEKIDSTLSKLDDLGQWWVFGHHTNTRHKLEWFRAGDASTGSFP